MCRIAAYQGKPCLLSEFLLAPPHSLYEQAWNAQELVSATVSADGWGVGWYADDGAPALYRHTLPIWSDTNVAGLGRSLTSSTWLGCVRSATPGLGTDMLNTQPFTGDGLLFVHNGFIDDFAHTLRRRLRAHLDEAIEAEVQGNTDSEYLFALIRQTPGSLGERLAAVARQVNHWLSETPDVRALLSLVVSDGHAMAGLRAAVNDQPPTLYYNAHWCDGAAIASEAFDDDSGWQRLEANQVVTFTSTNHPQVTTI